MSPKELRDRWRYAAFAAEAAAALADDLDAAEAAQQSGGRAPPIERAPLERALARLRGELQAVTFPVEEADEALERVEQALTLIDGALMAIGTGREGTD